jgi:integrase
VRQRGHIKPKGKGKWLAVVFAGRDATGKRRYTSKLVRGSKADAGKVLTALLQEVDRGVQVEPGKRTLGAYLEEWLKTSAKPRVSENTFRDYGKHLRKHVIPALGSKRLDQITAAQIRALYQSMADKGLGRTVQYTHSILRQALQGAVTDRLLTWNPAAGTKLPKNDRTALPRVFSAKEAAAFLKAAQGHPMEALFNLLLSTGLRPGEALALRWEDLDLQRGRLAVERALVERADGSYVVGPPKTKSSFRSVTLPQGVVAALHAHRARQAEEILAAGPEYERQDLAFANSLGRPMDLAKVRHSFKALLKATNKKLLKEAKRPEEAKLLPEIKLYSVRHTHATLLLEAGEDLKVVSERLGHATITMTANRYAQVTPKLQQQTATKVEEILYKAQ